MISVATIGQLTGVGSGWTGALGVPGMVKSPFSIANLVGLGTSGILEWLGLDDAAVQRGLAGIRKSLSKFADKGTISAEDVEAALGRITGTTELEAATDADIVVEAVFEDESVALAD